MLLAVDIGNSHTVLGLYAGERLVEHWRLTTSRERTADECAITLAQLAALAREPVAVDAAIVASVVPGAEGPLLAAIAARFGVAARVVGPGLRTGMAIRYENPKEVGADRIVNAVAAYARFAAATIVVDFGTATTFDAIDAGGAYLGGVIAPGAAIGAAALYEKAAKLPKVEIRRPGRVIGRTTVTSIQSGLYYGYAAMVDGIVRRMATELGGAPRVIATGGLAETIAEASETIETTDPFLTLEGLRLIHQRNAG